MPPRRPKPKDTPAKLASRTKRRWRIILLRSKSIAVGANDVDPFSDIGTTPQGLLAVIAAKNPQGGNDGVPI